MRNVLLGVQVAIAVVLVSAAGLFTRAVVDINSRDVGYSMRDLTAISSRPPARGFDASRVRNSRCRSRPGWSRSLPQDRRR